MCIRDRVVGGGDDHARVGAVLAHQIGHRRRGDDAQQLHVRAHAAQAGGQGAFQHVTGDARVLADEDARLVFRFARQHRRGRPADAHRQLRR